MMSWGVWRRPTSVSALYRLNNLRAVIARSQSVGRITINHIECVCPKVDLIASNCIPHAASQPKRRFAFSERGRFDNALATQSLFIVHYSRCCSVLSSLAKYLNGSACRMKSNAPFPIVFREQKNDSISHLTEGRCGCPLAIAHSKRKQVELDLRCAIRNMRGQLIYVRSCIVCGFDFQPHQQHGRHWSK